MNNSFTNYLEIYFANRPMFLGLIRAKELCLYEKEAHFAGRILDVGCGDGFFLKTYLENASKTKFNKIESITGLEVDNNVAKKAQQQHVYQQVITYDGKRIPFPDNSFDMVISNCVLEHIPNLTQTLSEIRRVLRPKGKFYCTIMTNQWEKYLFGKKLFGTVYADWMRRIQKHVHLLTAQQWQKTFTKGQFEIVKQIGYLDKKASRWIDIFHYLSFYSLLYYKLTGRWVLFPRLFLLLTNVAYFNKMLNKDINNESSAALFLICKNNKKVK